MSGDPTGKMRAVAQVLWPWLAAVSSGLLLAFSLPPFDQGWLAWIALAPLLCALWFRRGCSDGTGKRSCVIKPALLGYVTGIVSVTISFHWLSTLGPLFGSPALAGIPLLLALYMGLYVAVWAILVARLPFQIPAQTPALAESAAIETPERSRRARLLGTVPRGSDATAALPFRSSRRNLETGAFAACAWVLLEWIRGWLFSGFGWNGLGIALHRDLPTIQIADITGVLGLSWLVAFCNVMGVLIVRRMLAELGPRFLKSIRWEFTVTMALIVGVFAYGVRALNQPEDKDVTEFKIAMIQTNVPQEERWDSDSQEHLLKRLAESTQQVAHLKPDLIVWPESATPRGMYSDEETFKFVMAQAKESGAAILLGTVLSGEKPGDEYNGAALIAEGGHYMQFYRKMHLVPYGEYLPMRPLLGSVLGDLVPGDFLPGASPVILKCPAPPIQFGALICFEDTLGDLVRRFPAGGAQLLVNITNDAWFGKSIAAELHFDHAIFRAIENRRPLARCANTGVTGFVDARGRTDRLPLFTRAFYTRKLLISNHPPLTFYTRYGDWVAHLSLAIVFLRLGIHALRKSNKKRAIPGPEQTKSA